MKRLILIRHAKSSWDDPFSDDHARILNARGREDVDAMGQWLAQRGYIPDHIYSSDAARTVETTQRLIAAMGASPTLSYVEKLYHGAPATLLNVLQKAEGSVVAIVAHNPGIAFFAEGIVAAPPDHDRFMDYPTCGTLICDLPINDWADAVPRSAQVVDFVVPRDLSV